jgi:hypothetical protein
MAVESESENATALRESGAHVGNRKRSTEGWGMVDLPPSLVSKLREASHRTGLSLESLVWDAVDFYLEGELYQLMGVSPSRDALQHGGIRSAGINGRS